MTDSSVLHRLVPNRCRGFLVSAVNGFWVEPTASQSFRAVSPLRRTSFSLEIGHWYDLMIHLLDDVKEFRTSSSIISKSLVGRLVKGWINISRTRRGRRANECVTFPYLYSDVSSLSFENGLHEVLRRFKKVTRLVKSRAHARCALNGYKLRCRRLCFAVHNEYRKQCVGQHS